MRHLVTLLLLVGLAGIARGQEPERWRCTLEVEEGKLLPFLLEVDGGDAFILNDPERLAVAEYERTEATLRIGFPHFDSAIDATARDDGSYAGTWRKRRRGTEVAEVPFRMTPATGWRFEPINGLSPMASEAAGRWRVDFESSDADAVGLFEVAEGIDLRGTFLTRTGDYRFLAGDFTGSTLRLSCFDGAHAFLFEAQMRERGRLDGTFWSGNWWRESWSAERDDEITLPHAFDELELLSTATVGEALVLLPDGSERTLGEVIAEAYPAGARATLVQILGTWCPNCYDETEYLKELHAEYADRGLAVVGLCFELSGDAERDRAQVARFAETRAVPYPLVLAGEADKPGAAAALGLVDRVLSFPTTIFVDGAGRAVEVHSGFNGPATGDAHAELRREFTAQIEALLDSPASSDETWEALTGETWFDHQAFAGATWEFRTNERGEREAFVDVHGSGVRTVRTELHPVRLSGSTVLVGDEAWILDRAAGVLRRAGRPHQRLSRESIAPTVLTDTTADAHLHALLEHDSGLARREAVVALAYRFRYRSETVLPELGPLIDDPDPAVRRAAAYVAGAYRQATSIDALARALEASDPRLRALAMESLTRFEQLPPAVEELRLAVAANDPFPSVRAAATRE